MNKKFKIPAYVSLPIIFSLLLVTGVYMGTKMNVKNYSSIDTTGVGGNGSFTPAEKLNEIFRFIKSSYVDSVNENHLIDESLNGMLAHLDPHSYYIAPQKYAEMNEPLDGDFDGIGIEFRIINDTVNVLGTISGGPSERVGVKAGDKIIKVDTLTIAGNGINNQKVMKLLKGPKGTKVNITVYRSLTDKNIKFNITRDKIPITSVEAPYIIKDSIGYIRITRFAKNTYQEFHDAALKLKAEGMKKIIVDLRDNGGGIMYDAVKIADEFLKKGNLIVYTKGRARPRQDYYATSDGILQNTELAILINSGTASASEIFTGAIQDNDRGTIVGRRSFGKGLVQEQVGFPDGSALRLTVARYYTPSGRCIQKPYTNSIKKYREDTYLRYLHGEMFSADSIHFPDSLKYHTKNGKVVYGGGGIMPDYFIPLDTTQSSAYFSHLVYNGLFQEFALNYTDDKKNNLHHFSTLQSFDREFSISNKLLNQFIDFAAKHKVKKDNDGFKRSKTLIENRLKAEIAQNIFGDKGLYRVLNDDDKTIQKTIQLLEKNPKNINM